MRGPIGTTDRAPESRLPRALGAAAAGALVLFTGAPHARDPAGPFTTLPPPSPPLVETLRVRTLPFSSGDDVRVSEHPDQALAEVTIDVNPLNPDNLVIAGYSRSIKTISTFHSLDAGRTWTHVPVGHAHDDLGAEVDRFDPTLVFDARGFVYVGYGARVPVPGTFSDHLVVCRSVDGGRTFEPGVIVWVADDVNGHAGNDKFHLAAGPDRFDESLEVVLVAWTWNILPPFGIVDQQIAVSRSIDAGLSFSAPVVINDDSISDRDFAIFADPAIGPDGVMYGAWNDLNTNDIRVDHSFDNGRTWGRDVVVERETVPFRMRIPPQPNRGVFAGPVLDVDRSGGPHHGRVYLVYCHGTDEDTDILVRHSDDHANTFSPAVRVNDDAPGSYQFLPWLDVNQTSGRVNVVFYDTREDTLNHQSRVLLAASDTGGESFFPNLPVADVPSNNGTSNPARYPGNFLEYIGVAAWGCDAFVTWTDTRNAPLPLTDYFFDRVPADSTAPTISVALDQDLLWPPDRRFVEVNAVVTVGDDRGASFVLESVTHNDAPGSALDGVQGADLETPDVSFRLRAERSGKGNGRVYTVVYRAFDACGNAARDTARVAVRHHGGRPSRTGAASGAASTAIRSVFPNPLNPTTTIQYETSLPGRVRVAVVDIRGRIVVVLTDRFQPAGQYTITWNGLDASGSPVASGVYVIRMQAGPVVESRKVVVVR